MTRKEYSADEDGPLITLDEWKVYVASDMDLEPDHENPGPRNAVLITHPDRWTIRWRPPGEIVAKNPDATVVAKLVQIARVLNARVLGDDDEIYGIDARDPTKFRRR